MRRALVVLAVGGVALAAPPSLTWDGKLSWDLATAAVKWASDLSLAWDLGPWKWTTASSFADGAWTKLLLSGSGRLKGSAVTPSVEFNPQALAFKGAKLCWRILSWEGVEFRGVARLEEKGFGWGLSLRSPPGSLVERVRLRFNLKRQLDEVKDATFTPSFSFGEARFSIPLSCCLSRIRGWVRFTKAGFEEAGVSFPLPGKLDCGISFWVSLRFRIEEKRASLFPSLVYQGPAGVALLLGLDWDPATSTLRGISLYGFGFHGKVGDFRFRSLTGLAEDKIDLVKDPYWELMELIWKVPGCCGDGEAAVTFYFGDDGPFGLGEVELRAEAELAPGARVGARLELPVGGGGKIGFTWQLRL
ncbi:MAG TPA: hypothetical protein ENN53_00125 [Candidatus Acetothermia bacterium]|nr:hypothetical protein [Candidatus Acetothermia bacterium]